MNHVHFAAPLYLWALCLLPVLWRLLRLTPPKPKRQIFPPLRLMRQFSGGETAAARSPWWLTLLRLLLAALLILAFAQPSRFSAAPAAAQNGALALVWDNSWAGAKFKQQQFSQAQRLISAAGAHNGLIYLIPSVSAANSETGPFSGDEALKGFAAMPFYALPPERGAAFAKLGEIIAARGGRPLTIAYLTDGMAAPGDGAAFAALEKTAQNLPPRSVLIFKPPPANFIGIARAANGANGLSFTLIRAENSSSAPLGLTVQAYDEKERLLAETQADFKAGASAAAGKFDLPPIYANAAAALRLTEAKSGADNAAQTATAAAVRLLNSADRQKTVAILAPRSGSLAQPLLSPLYYAAKALEGAPGVAGGKAIQADSGSMEQNIDHLLSARPALLIMGDTAAISPQAKAKLRRWVEQGGTLFRFGGAKLAQAGSAGDEADDGGQAEAEAIFGGARPEADSASARRNARASPPEQNLLPVRLRRGERSFGGSLSWEKPQALAPFAQNSPFYGLPAPKDITVSKQILAEPSADLADKSWISLRDGTPLLTAAKLGEGRLILLHTEPSGSWSNLALSGFFVQMLQKITQISGNGGAENSALPRDYAPYRILAADGHLETAPETARAITAGGGKAAPEPSFSSPPGLYGGAGVFYPLNLLTGTARIAPLRVPPLPALRTEAYSAGANGWQKLLFLLAACLFLIDSALNLALKSRFSGFSFGAWQSKPGALLARAGKAGRGSFILLAAAVCAAVFFTAAPRVFAAPAKAYSVDGLSAPALAGKTHLAYVLSGNAELDGISRAGLENLSRFIERRTTIEPGEPVGLNLSHDELSFYPLIYWPIDAQTPLPPAKALAAADAFMQRGGTILFDTRDALNSGLQLSGASAGAVRLREILKNMNVPPLAPAPAESVVARSFYIMPDFPGRYRGAPLWIAAASAGAGADSAEKGSSIRGGDGVSPVLITANDFAAAWAGDGKGGFLFPLVPDGEEQRLWAFRGGLNIVMYVLTGNYKADQAHTPELLRRFGRESENEAR